MCIGGLTRVCTRKNSVESLEEEKFMKIDHETSIRLRYHAENNCAHCMYPPANTVKYAIVWKNREQTTTVQVNVSKLLSFSGIRNTQKQ